MIGKVKKALGIEGVKIKLILAPEYPKVTKKIRGDVQLTSLSDNIVQSIEIRMMERYARGRKEKKLVNDYVIGRIILDEAITIKKDETISIPFTLPYIDGKSDMDKLEEDNILLSGFIKLAKYLKKVKSTYRVVAEASVKGTKLQPHAEVEVVLM